MCCRNGIQYAILLNCASESATGPFLRPAIPCNHRTNNRLFPRIPIYHSGRCHFSRILSRHRHELRNVCNHRRAWLAIFIWNCRIFLHRSRPCLTFRDQGSIEGRFQLRIQGKSNFCLSNAKYLLESNFSALCSLEPLGMFRPQLRHKQLPTVWNKTFPHARSLSSITNRSKSNSMYFCRRSFFKPIFRLVLWQIWAQEPLDQGSCLRDFITGFSYLLLFHVLPTGRSHATSHCDRNQRNFVRRIHTTCYQSGRQHMWRRKIPCHCTLDCGLRHGTAHLISSVRLDDAERLYF